MVCSIHPEVQSLPPTGPLPTCLEDLPASTPERDRICHLLLGSPASVQATVHSLHALNYVDQTHWSQVVVVPSTGLIITPEQGEVMRYLIRHRLRQA